MRHNSLAHLLLAGVALVLLAGCARESYGPSPQVTFLWQQHPSPWSQQAAQAAAQDAKGLLATHPGDMQLHFYYQDRLGSFNEESMIAEYQAMLARDTTDARMILLEARAVGGRNRMADRLKKAAELAPRDPYVLTYAAWALLRSRPVEQDKALAFARQAVEIAPEMGEAHEALARALLEYESYDEALAEGEKAIQLNPWSFDPVQATIQILLKLERPEAALQKVEEFAETQPLHPSALRYLERMYREKGELERIIDRKRLSAQANPEEGWAWLDLTSTYLELGWMDSAFSALNSAADEGYIDLDYTKRRFSEEQLRSIATHPGWLRVQARMKQKRIETADERRQKALSEKLAIPAPDFTAMTLDGKSVGLSDMAGKVVILDFWATWCGPCKLTIPRLKEFHKAGALGAELISLNVWERVSAEERPGLVGEFARTDGMNWRVWLGKNETADAYDVLGIPTFVVIDRQGVIRYKIVGYQPFIDELLGWMVEDVEGAML